MNAEKTYIVQVFALGGWIRSQNTGADGRYTKAGAQRRAKLQMEEMGPSWKYRIKKVKK